MQHSHQMQGNSLYPSTWKGASGVLFWLPQCNEDIHKLGRAQWRANKLFRGLEHKMMMKNLKSKLDKALSNVTE